MAFRTVFLMILFMSAMAISVMAQPRTPTKLDPKVERPAGEKDKDPDPYRISLNSRRFVPEEDVKILGDLAGLETERYHLILQFHQKPTLKEHKSLFEEDVQLEEFLGGTAYLASVPTRPEKGKDTWQALVRWAGELEPNDKLMPDLAADRIHDWAINPATGRLKIVVQFYQDVADSEIVSMLSKLGLKGKPYGPLNTFAVEIDKKKLMEVAGLKSVKTLEQGPWPFVQADEGARRTANTDNAQQPTWYAYTPGYRVGGSGIKIGICDTGVDEFHYDFGDPWNQNSGPTRVYNIRSGSGKHGTKSAGIAAGNGFNSVANGYPAFSTRGQAPLAGIGDYPQFGSDKQLYFNALVTDGTDVTNHSYWQTGGTYVNKSAEIDLIIRGDAEYEGQAIPARPQVWSAGNNGVVAPEGKGEGYYSIISVAKNSISVGSIKTHNFRLSDYTSLGPTFDGRIKPDVVAPGESLIAADDSTQGYIPYGGTSASAPVVSGIIALMMEMYEDEFDSHPDLFPATYKAILVHTARDQIKTKPWPTVEFNNPDTGEPVRFHAGPDFSTGYGLVDAAAAVDKIADGSMWRQETIASTADVQKFCISVGHDSGPLKVVMAWDDEPGSAVAAQTEPRLVNDLDLVVYDPDGNPYLPWTLDPPPLTADVGSGDEDPITYQHIVPARKDEDHLNNVEMVSTCDADGGIWTVEVKAHALPMGNAQPYTLVSSHEFITCQQMFIAPTGLEWMNDFESYQRPPTHVIPDIWEFDPGNAVIDLERICQYVLDCPGCFGPGWSYCPGMEISLEGLPQQALVTIFNAEGKIRAEDSTFGRVRRLRLENIRPGEQLFIAMTDKTGQPLKDPVQVKFDVKDLEP